MIVGVFLRNYKAYNNLNFIPLIKSQKNSLSIFIGPNGSGKSSVIEALDCLFNNREWNVSLGQKGKDSSICPVFLIPKSDLNNPKADIVSTYFWNTDFLSINNQKATADFCALRDELKAEVDTNEMLLIPVGGNFERKTIFTSTFHPSLFNHIRPKGCSLTDLETIRTQIYSLYSYIYIPVDLSPSEILSLQAREMQGFMDKSVVDEIKHLFERKETPSLPKTKTKSIVNTINDRLSEYISSINSAMGEGYVFGKGGTSKKNIKANDFIGIVINEFFIKRPLTKDGKEIKKLSSGEQRLALIDLAYSFLKRKTEKNKKVFLAIDEPEASLQNSLCLEQFYKLFEIGGKFGHQVAITTHWYGLLITTANGYLHCVEPNRSAPPTINTLKLYRLHEERRKFPDQVEMKSFFDLISSILSIIKYKQHNWIICEGFDDVCYLKAHLQIEDSNTTIIPLNGCGNVLKVFKFLRVPFEDKKENAMIKGRILCITDSDAEDLLRIPDFESKATNRKLDLWRWHVPQRKATAMLVNTGNNSAVPTEIEDCLNPEAYYRAIVAVSQVDAELNDMLRWYSKNEHSKLSLLRDLDFLTPKGPKGFRIKPDVISKLSSDEIKHAVAQEYLANILESEKDIPWATNIKEFLN
ncbi:AAA family ATPase [Pseudomonas qingdaonensis]|uniref:AAA family ATPase n=1 Tax=Pseudomonas qingdaonensis TaxID=2056231 RepID=UPI000C285640|nr:AAA family ATPase [Pseudomonas qingdaonensis]